METEHNHQLIVTIVNKGWSETVVKASGRPARRAVPLFMAGAPVFTKVKPFGHPHRTREGTDLNHNPTPADGKGADCHCRSGGSR